MNYNRTKKLRILQKLLPALPKILFIAAHRLDRSPSQRFRFEQYFTFLEENGFKCQLSFLLSKKQDQAFYKNGNLLHKIYIVINSFFIRMADVLNASDYDIIFIQREAFMTGLTFFERKFYRSKAKMIFDFDDAIWMNDTSEANKKFEWLKNPGKTKELISLSDMVFAGNRYLADYALRFNKRVKIIPTSIDTEKHKRSALKNSKEKICIGWTGSITTIKHLNLAETALLKLKEKYGNKIYFKVIGDSKYINEKLGIKGIPWSLQDEIKELEEIDIGIMPLPNDEWSKGKCGFKGLQYMALEIPAVMSPVGVNTEIIQDGINGFLADREDEWVKKISLLIEDDSLRQKIGKEARKTVIQKYSFDSQKENYLNYFNGLLES